MRYKGWDVAFLATAVAIVIGLILLIIALFAQMPSLINYAGLILGALVPSLAFLYSQIQKRSLKFQVLTNRLKSWLSGRPLTWNVSAVLKGDSLRPDVLNTVAESLLGSGTTTPVDKIRRVDARTILVELGQGPTVEISYNPPSIGAVPELEQDEQAYVLIAIRNYRVGYRQARHAMRREIAPVLETIASVIGVRDTKYSVKIGFADGKNPFFGMLLTSLPPQAVAAFVVRLRVDDYGPGDEVSISTSSMSITTRSQGALQNLTLEFLTFDSIIQERLKNG